MPKNYVPLPMRREIIERAKGYCEYCQLPASFSPSSFNFEHIIPIIKQGLTDLENLAFSCGGCNAYKKDKTEAIDPLTRELSLLFNPRINLWSEHFEWNNDDLQIIGSTPVGRATVQLLKVNRDGNINLRKLLKMAGLHPPDL
jgi:HNH endonuclease